MENEGPFTPISYRRSKFIRSQSAQPEEWALSSSPYSAQRKPKSPGRSLTAIFTRNDHRERASSEDHISRRRTIDTNYCDLKRYDHMQEIEEVPMDISNPDMQHHNVSLPIYPDLDGIDDSYISNNQNSYIYTYEEEGFDSVAVASRVSSSVRRRNVIPTGDSPDITTPESKSYSPLCSILMRIGKIFFWCSVLLVLFLLLLFSLSTLLVYQKKHCEQKQSLKIPLDTLKEQLTSHIIGQEIATDVLLSSLRELENNNSKEPLVMWMVGWSGSGKTQTINILKNLFPDPTQIRTFIPSILMVSSSSLQKDIARILKKFDSCSANMIIIDGWDEDDDMSINVLRIFFKEFRKHLRDGNNGRSIVIVSGTEGSREINREYLKYRLMGKDRETLKLSHFRNIIKKIVETRKLNEIIDELVVLPFMPLEKSQVEECVMQELDKMEENSSKMMEGQERDEKHPIIQEVIKQINFVPPAQPLLSATGCKRVQPLLRLLLSEAKLV